MTGDLPEQACASGFPTVTLVALGERSEFCERRLLAAIAHGDAPTALIAVTAQNVPRQATRAEDVVALPGLGRQDVARPQATRRIPRAPPPSRWRSAMVT